MHTIPTNTQVMVIGGGPGGSTAATLLARQGYDVTLLERSHFPRYHIGESLLPTILQIADLLGAREKLEAYGFQRKDGAFLEWGAERWPLNFGELSGSCTYAFQVVRSEFDQMMLEHSKSQGVKVFEGVEVSEIAFDGDRPRRASWILKDGPNNGFASQGQIAFDYLIDASGRSSLMANRYLRNRRFHKVFQNVAIWAYWEDAEKRLSGREGDIIVNSIPGGWFWAIPLHDGTMSVGVVMHKDLVMAKKGMPLEAVYCEAMESAELIKKVVESARQVSQVFSETDYSYASERFAGPGYFMVGDAACFLDPLLSSGVHLATFSALLAAASFSSMERGEVSEEEAISYFEHSYRQAYLRFLVFLSAFYDISRGKEALFSEAQRLTEQDIRPAELKQAFLKLVTGQRDLTDAQSDEGHLVLEEMTRRIDENLHFRQDKEKLAMMDADTWQAATANARFFSSVEGLFALNEEEAINGLYVATQPRLRLARARAG
jgi:flavin-dependent dehydrogenase